MSTATAKLVKCNDCQKPHDPEELSGCYTCGIGFCMKCHKCACDDIRELMEDLTAAANRTGKHRELRASLRVTLAGLQAA
jgi:hypothetical protein